VVRHSATQPNSTVVPKSEATARLHRADSRAKEGFTPRAAAPAFLDWRARGCGGDGEGDGERSRRRRRGRWVMEASTAQGCPTVGGGEASGPAAAAAPLRLPLPMDLLSKSRVPAPAARRPQQYSCS
jgi:hypothetical protein